MAGIYFHIPFCKKRCLYCDFFSSTDQEKKERYIGALCDELWERRDYLRNEPVETIYFGGGTPSQLSAKDFEKVFDSIVLADLVGESLKDLEVTLEANPDDITAQYLGSINHLPFNRISLGVQSLNDGELRFLNRRHDAASAVRAVKLCQEFGFDNISIDLMYGLPGQTLEIWEETLRQALRLNVQHISAYHLIYEENTPLFTLLERGSVVPLEEEVSVRLFEILIHTLANAGFEHYEISNFAQPGFRSKHNSSYWSGAFYLGIGAAAHSYDGVSRQWNKKTATANYRMEGQEKEIIDEKTAYNDFVITRLRVIDGIELEELVSLFGEEKEVYCLRQAEKYIENQLLERKGNRLRLTTKGIFVSDGIMSDLLV